jgi:hypothetical protein
VLGVAVENRSLGTNSGNFGHLILWNANLFATTPKTKNLMGSLVANGFVR